MTHFDGIALATLAALCWGFLYSSTQVILASNVPITVLAPLAFVVCGAVSLPFLIYACWEQPDIVRTMSGVSKADWVLHFASFLLARLFNVFAVRSLGGTAASLVELSFPLWTALFIWLAQSETPTRGDVIGGMFILAGVFIVGSGSGGSSSISSSSQPSVPPPTSGSGAAYGTV